jgi:hypothetical protein
VNSLSLRFCLLAVVLSSCGRAEKPASPRVPDQPISTFARLSDAFQKARAPEHADLTGVWVETRSIATRPFLEGRNGPDQVLFDSTGLKVENGSAKPFSWTLTFAKVSPATYAATQRMGGQVSQIDTVELDSSATFRFHPSFGADEVITYTCRIAQSDRAVCLDLDHPGSGVEFKQISTTVPPRPPPVCPLADMTECSASGTSADARRILAGSRICYHLLSPLTHRPDRMEGTDTWLALSGDSLAPVGMWQPAAVFDDSIVRLAAWRRAPQRDSLELRLTLAGTNVRGELSYSEAALNGTVFAEETPYSWGVEGTRRACPSRR